MDRFGIEGSDPTFQIWKSIERAQKKVEENNFGIRKRLLGIRRCYERPAGSSLQTPLPRPVWGTFAGGHCQHDFRYGWSGVETNKGAQDFKNFEFELIRYFSMSSPISKSEFENMGVKEAAGKVYKAAYNHYQGKNGPQCWNGLSCNQNVFETKG